MVRARAHQQRLAGIDSWQLTGGVGIWSDAQSASAHVDWYRAAEHFTLTLSGPLGVGDLRLVDDGTGARLWRGDKLLQGSGSADALLQQALDLDTRLPLEALGEWLLGQVGRSSSQTYRDNGLVDTLEHVDADGRRWQARILRYEEIELPAGAGTIPLPVLISAEGGLWQIRVKISQWQLNPQEPSTPQSGNRLPGPARLQIPGR